MGREFEHVDVRAAAASITIKIRIIGQRRLRLRMMVTALILQFAAWVSPCPIEVSTD